MIYTPAPRDPKQPPIRINLLSDTQTRPTPGMREAIANGTFETFQKQTRAGWARGDIAPR